MSVNGLAVRTARRANSSGGTPLVIFNGIGAALEMLQPFIDAVPDLDVITFDAPGAGRSAAPSLPWRFSHYAEVAARVMDDYGVTAANVAGMSWGGALAQQFVRQYPERVNRLILGVTTPGHIMVPGKLSALIHMAHPRRYVDPDYLKRVAPMLYGGKMRTNRLSASEYAELMTPPSQLGYYYQALAGFGQPALAPQNRATDPGNPGRRRPDRTGGQRPDTRRPDSPRAAHDGRVRSSLHADPRQRGRCGGRAFSRGAVRRRCLSAAGF